jgi:hypothetical protein
MRTFIKTLFAMMLCGGEIVGSAQATPQEETDRPSVVVLDTLPTCPQRGGLCLTAAESTMRVPTLLAEAPGASVISEDAPLFQRSLPPEPYYRVGDDDVPWKLDVSASFRRAAQPGNTLFVLTDTADPEQTRQSHVVTALYQTAILGGERLAAELSLSPQDGFRASHTYKLRVVQLIKGKEVELASGSVQLM